MTKQQAIKELVNVGAEGLEQRGKYQVAFIWQGRLVVGDPRDLLAEIRQVKGSE